MKKNMRKVAALGLCVALGATMLTACGGSKGESASGGKTELNFGIWDENQRPAMEKMVKAYEKENSDVKINIQLTPYKGGEYWTKLEAAARYCRITVSVIVRRSSLWYSAFFCICRASFLVLRRIVSR